MSSALARMLPDIWDKALSAVPALSVSASTSLPGAELHWREWVRVYAPHVAGLPMAPRHARLWEWFEGLTPGVRPMARIEPWPRGGGKSTSAELGVARLCVKLSRRYVLYVSGTQDQADKHVGAIAAVMEKIGIERSLNVYGNSRGWRRQELRTANGFNVSAYGLDSASRGVKLDQFRPDLIIFDDVDSHADTPRTVEKKIQTITNALIPAGSTDCGHLFIQNLVHEDGVVARLVDGRADFLASREPAVVEPAVIGLTYDTTTRPDGVSVYRITGGTPTWIGQDLATCESQLNDWGPRAFLREAQHDVASTTGRFFLVDQIRYCEPGEVPHGLRYCRAWDLAATEGGGDWTVGALIGMQGHLPHVRVWVCDVRRVQYSSEKVRQLIRDCRDNDPEGTTLWIPQDPGQAGKAQFQQFARALGAVGSTVTGQKSVRATGVQECLNLGNLCFVVGDWNRVVRENLRRFQADELDQLDDDVDALSAGFNHLAGAAGKPLQFFSL